MSAWAEFHAATAGLPGPLCELHPLVTATLPKVWACSPFVMRHCCRDPGWLADSRCVERLLNLSAREQFRQVLQAELQQLTGDQERMVRLRRFRNREMARLAWRDIAGWSSIDDTLRETSELAEVVVEETLALLYRDACDRCGVMAGEADAPPQLLVLGMGKLGAWELNFSSDIDLIFGYRAEGVLPDRKSTSYNEFYTRLAQRLIQVLDRVTEDGFVYRVDMRLRPFGASGPLVLNFEAMERYYQSQAREWERYAMVKARPIAGDAADRRELADLLRPFIYRRYLDYRAFGELRQLKDKITLELKRNDRLDNVKLGPGGIREIEFIGQAFQLIRGGSDKDLQERRILSVLEMLGEKRYLPVRIVSRLTDAYRFLRTVENRLQQYEDRQTHDLPGNPLQQSVLAFGMGFPDWASFRVRVEEVRRQAHEVFDQIMAAPHTEGAETDFFSGDESALADILIRSGFRSLSSIGARLKMFLESSAIKRLSSNGRGELNRLLPLLLRALAGGPSPEVGLERILGLLEAIASRNVYFALLTENPLALSQLVKLSTASAWIVHYITQFPILLDELLDPRSLYRPLTRAELSLQLDQKIASVDVSDLEQLMAAIRHVKQANVLRVAATDIMGITPLMVVSDYLTYIAEAVVAAVLRHSWRLTAARHGVPVGGASEDVAGFGVVAYGKLGGLELGYGSDLDLVFLHRDVDDSCMTDGAAPLTAVEFYGRVARRVISLMTTRTHAGTLYDIDIRLRPSGNSGLLVSSLEAYEAYQMHAAWTWEQQALVRARFIAGDEAVGARFRLIRENALTRPRDIRVLREEVRAMREKMREQLGVKQDDAFDLKQGYGGIADIEFIVQFGVLAHSHDHPGLARWTDVIRLLECLRDLGFLSGQDAELLRLAYCRYREQLHRCALQELPALVSRDRTDALRKGVQAIWHSVVEV